MKPDFADIRQIHWWYQHNRALAARLLVDYISPGIRSLDAGGSAGPNGSWLSAFGELFAACPAEKAVGSYRTEAPAARPIAARLDALPFAGASFDVVVAVSAMHEVDAGDPRGILDEYARVLVPGGGVCMIEPVWHPRGMNDDTGRYFSTPYLAGIAEASGLVIDRCTRANISPRLEGVVEPGAGRLGLPEVRGSDLEWGKRPVRNALWFIAALERTYLMSHDLGFGASAVVVAHKARDRGNRGE